MTLHWGHKIILVFIVFGALMTFLVYRSLNTDFQLVSKDYYKDELEYQKVIEGKTNANGLAQQATVSITGQNITVALPTQLAGKQVSGAIWFYSPTNAANDVKYALPAGENASFTYKLHDFKKGNYIMKLQCVSEGKSFYFEKDFIVP